MIFKIVHEKIKKTLFFHIVILYDVSIRYIWNKKMKLNHKVLYDVLIFSILMAAAILMGISLKNEISWDLTNYHYYNAWAFFNDRLNFDIVPASFNTFLNPIMDLPLYFYIKWFNDYPTLVWALQSIWGGLMLFFVYKIVALFFDFKNILNLCIFAVLCAIILTGEGVGTQLGSSANEIPVATFTLWGLYLLLKMIKFPKTQTFKKFITAGLIMGIGLGLKQTVVTYCIASGLTLIICYKFLNKPFQSIFFFALGGLVGYLIINGYFMYKYWVLYGNPFFPFLNGIFHSPYFDDFNYRDTRFLPSFKNFLIFPFLWYKNPYEICENYYSDIRLTLYYIVFVLFSVHLLFSKRLRTEINQNKSLKMLFVFLVLSYFIWLFLFSYMRYAVVIEVVGAVFTMLLIIRYSPKKKIPFIIYGSCFIILAGALYLDFKSIYRTTDPIKQKIFIEPVTLPDSTLIKLYGLPGAALIPFLEKGNKTIRAMGYTQHYCSYLKGSDLSDHNQFRKMRDDIEKNHKGPVIFIYTDPMFIKNLTFKEHKAIYLGKPQKSIFGCPTWSLVLRALAEDMPENYECRKINTNLIDKSIYMCFPKHLENTIFLEPETKNE